MISSNVSGMFAISSVFAFAKTLPAVERYGSFLFSAGLKYVEFRNGSVWYVSVW